MKTALLLLLACVQCFGIIIPTNRLPAGNSTNWQGAGMAARGGIPDSSAMTVYTNVPLGTTLSQLNTWIAACPSNQVVQMTNGAFTFNGNLLLRKDGGVLRGNRIYGAETHITFGTHGGGNNIHIGNETINRTDPSSGSFILSWTAGYSHGATTITVSNTTGLPAVGHMLVLDQLNDNVWVDDDIQEGCTYCGRNSGERSQAQYVFLESVSGNDLTISPGLYMENYRSAMAPQVWGWTADDNKMIGLEDLIITNTSGSGVYSVYISQAHNCWVKGVAFHGIRTAAIATSQVKNIEARQIALLSGESAESQSYGVIWYMASDCLLVDSISHSVTGTMNYSPQAEGCVVSYNYITNNIYDPSNWDIAGLASHDGHVCMNLAEGNWVNKMFYDSIHGSASHNTDFRNYYHGHQVDRVNNTIAYAAQQFVLSNNVVANILGTAGYHTFRAVTNLATFSPHFSDSVYRFGEGDAADGDPYDTRVYPSTITHGNWEASTETIVWDAGIADHDYPDSYYLTAKPAFFGAIPWPPYDPANPTANSPTNLPAGVRWINYVNSDNVTELFGEPPVTADSASINATGITATGVKLQ